MKFVYVTSCVCMCVGIGGWCVCVCVCACARACVYVCVWLLSSCASVCMAICILAFDGTIKMAHIVSIKYLRICLCKKSDGIFYFLSRQSLYYVFCKYLIFTI